MPRTTGLGLLSALCAALLLAGCGGGGSSNDIPAAAATEMQNTLDEVQNNVASGDCTKAAEAATRFVGLVDGLPATAGADLKQALRTGGLRLENLVSTQCTSQPSQQSSSSSSSTPSGASGAAGAQGGG